MGDMTGQVALVTGGTRGIGGAAISERLVGRGVSVAAGYSRDKESAEVFGGPGMATRSASHQGNIGSAEDCERVIAEVLERHGKLDILVNNAGITADRTVRRMGAGGLGPGRPGQSLRRLLSLPRDPAAHAGQRVRADHQYQLDHRGVRNTASATTPRPRPACSG